jgi:hypothetical protein
MRGVGAATVLLALTACRHPRSTPAPARFTDVTAAAGIARAAPTYDATVGDFDGDGNLDVYVGNHGTGAVLLRNLGDGRFADVIGASGVEPLGDQHGTGWTDYDNDGLLDLYVSVGAGRGLATKSNRLYHNEGGGTFRDVAVSAGVEDPNGRARAVAWLDFDGDGWLDLVIANFASPNRLFRNRHDGTFEDVSEATGIAALSATRVAWADYDADGWPDLLFSGTPKGMRLLHNDGGARFSDVTDGSGLGAHQGSIAGMAFGDYDGDGVLDLYVSLGVDFSDVVLEQPEAKVTFAFFAHEEPSGVDFETVEAEGGVDATLFENGTPARAEQIRCATTHPAAHAFRCDPRPATSDGPPPPADGFTLWRDATATPRCPGCAPALVWHLRWQGAGDHHLTGILGGAARPVGVGLRPQTARGGTLFRGTGDGRFVAQSPHGLDHEANGQAVQWADVNDDGRLDLYVVDSGVDGAGARNHLFLNAGDGRFAAVQDSGATPESGAGRGASAHFFDADADGRLDLLLTNGWGAPPFDRGPYYLLHNVGSGGHWLGVALQGARSNRAALGARVEISGCGTRQVRYHNGGASYFSQSIVPPHFGLGRCERLRMLRVIWPSGATQDLEDVAVDRVLHVREEP